MINGQYSGESRLATDAEIPMTQTDTNGMTSAIESDGIQLKNEPVVEQRTVEREEYNRSLGGRDRLLEAVATAANALLTLENIEQGIDTALKAIMEGSGCDRINVSENYFDGSSTLPLYCTIIYEMAIPGFSKQTFSLEPRCIHSEGIDPAFLERYFLHGNGFGGLLEEWEEPLRAAFAAFQVKSAYTVPIRVNGHWWGVLCLDYCRDAIQISSAEVAVLRTIADCIGSAIQGDRVRREREEVAQQRAADLEKYNKVLRGRDRLLEATANATNVLLTQENFDEAINSALKIIVDGADCDRINVLEGSFDAPSIMPTHHTVIYEWARPNIMRQMSHQESVCIPSQGIEAFLEQHYLKGNGFGGFLEEWQEPLRSAFAAVQVKSSYSVPIRVNGQWWGVLCLDYCQEAIRISPAEVAVLRTIADCIGSAIQRNRTQKIILEAEQKQVAELAKANDALKQSLNILPAERDLGSFVGHILGFIAQQFDSPLTEYWVYSDEEKSGCFLNLTCWQGKILHPEEQPGHPGISGIAILPERRHLLDRSQILTVDPEFLKTDAADWYFAKGVAHYLDIPLYLGETLIGSLDIFLPGDRPFLIQAIGLAHALAQQLTLAIELTRLAEESRQTALLQERTRMAREIHDTLAQAFGGILMQLQAFSYFATAQPQKAQTHLQTAQTLAQDGLAEARRSVWTLYLETAEYEDPSQTIAKFIEHKAPGHSVKLNLAIDGIPFRLHPDLGLNLLRIAQESINNALRHAEAQTIQIHLNYSPQSLQLIVHDDGCGFDPKLPTGRFGLLGMQQRAARFGATWHLTSQLGQGTTITVTIANPASL